MCGAATFLTQDSLQTLISDFRVTRVDMAREPGPNYNLRPMQNALLVREVGGERVLQEAQWWLVPQFEPEPKTKLTTFNARSEKLMQGMFRPYLLSSRALFIVDSYFEWRKEGKERLPYRFIVDGGKHFALAALFSLWRSRDGTVQLPTCSMITTAANAVGAPVHDRMPAILDPSLHADWLSPGLRDPGRLLAMAQSFPGERMSAYRVSSLVNSSRNNVAECIAPVVENPSAKVAEL